GQLACTPRRRLGGTPDHGRLRAGAARPRAGVGRPPAGLRRSRLAPVPLAPAGFRQRLGGDARRRARLLAAAARHLPAAAAGFAGPRWLVAGARGGLRGVAAVVAQWLGAAGDAAGGRPGPGLQRIRLPAPPAYPQPVAA